MLEFIDGLKTSVVGHVQTTDDYIKVSHKVAKRLEKMKDGNHIYLTLKYLDRYEIVKFTKDGPIKDGKVPVERDILSEGRRNFPCSSCLVAEWSSTQLKEFICQTKDGCQ